jgi:hypothetical protein
MVFIEIFPHKKATEEDISAMASTDSRDHCRSDTRSHTRTKAGAHVHSDACSNTHTYAQFDA